MAVCARGRKTRASRAENEIRRTRCVEAWGPPCTYRRRTRPLVTCHFAEILVPAVPIVVRANGLPVWRIRQRCQLELLWIFLKLRDLCRPPG